MTVSWFLHDVMKHWAALLKVRATCIIMGSNKKSNHINFSERKRWCLSKPWTLMIRVSLTWNRDDHWYIKLICDFLNLSCFKLCVFSSYSIFLLCDWVFDFVGIQYCLFTGRFIGLVLISLWPINLFQLRLFSLL